MIAFIQGVLVARTSEAVVIETGGFGMQVYMPASSISKLPEVGKNIRVFTYLHVREDALTLYGFATMEEKTIFERLISVSGIGPKVALSAVSSYTPEALSKAIMAGDSATVARIPGIGKKTAQRIILELKGTLEKEASLFENVEETGSPELQQAKEDLLALGFTSTEADLALKGAPNGTSETSLVQYALKRLGS